ncbi:hypothetical protein ACEPAH_4238 [Sanghuangporus vaninii]
MLPAALLSCAFRAFAPHLGMLGRVDAKWRSTLYNPQVILIGVLRQLGREKATGPYSAFALGLIEKRYVYYVDRSEYDGYEAKV